MFNRLFKFFRTIYIADIGTAHARKNFPRDEHAVAWPLFDAAPKPAVEHDAKITPIHSAGDIRHG